MYFSPHQLVHVPSSVIKLAKIFENPACLYLQTCIEMKCEAETSESLETQEGFVDKDK